MSSCSTPPTSLASSSFRAAVSRLVRLTAALNEDDAREVGGVLQDDIRQLLLQRVGELLVVDERQDLHLLLDRLHHLGDAVTDHADGGAAADGVKVLPALVVVEA